MKMLVRERSGTALAVVLMALTAAGCGVVYKPQQFAESSFSYGYQGDFQTAIDLVPLTFSVARVANADNYTPRSLPAAFAQTDDAGSSRASIQSRLAAAGLDRVDPPVSFDPATGFSSYDGAREVLPVVPRNDNLSPLPSLDLYQNPLNGRTGSSSGAALPESGSELISPLDPLTLRREARNNPLPRVTQPPYRIGPGDVLSLQSQARALPSLDGVGDIGGSDTVGAQNLLVQDNGEVFIPIVGPVKVSELTLSKARERISDRLADSQIGVDAGMQIVKFGSKRIAVSGLSGNQLIPITVSPTTLGEAITLSGGFGENPDNTIVRVLRSGDIYEMSGDRIADSSQLTDRILLDGDIVSVTPAYNLDLALTYFDQQLRLRSLDRDRLGDAITRRGEGRAVQSFERDGTRLEIELENYRLQADRLRQEAEIAALTSRRATDRSNEDALQANLVARQAYLDQLRTLEETNRNALRALRAEQRTISIANQAERSRARTQQRELLQFELDFELQEIGLSTAADQRSRALFTERLGLGAVQQDHVTIAGETTRQMTVALPFDGQLTLNRVLYEQANGINLTTGDSSEIYVFRTPRDPSLADRLTVYHLDASNPAALAVASMFEMRPNDVVYVNPQPITTWNRVLTQILPSTGLLQNLVTAVP